MHTPSLQSKSLKTLAILFAGLICFLGLEGFANAQSIVITASPMAVTLTPGSSVNVNINVARTNYTGSVSLTLMTTLPAGVTVTYTNPGTGNTGIVRLTASTSCQLVNGLPVRVQAFGSGVTAAYVTFSLTVAWPPGIATFNVTPSSVTLAPGGSVQVPVTITREAGFTGSVSLLVTSSLPTGVSATYTHPGTGNSGSVNLSASTSCQIVSDYQVTVRASATGVQNKTDTFLLTTSFPPGIATFSITPSSVTLSPGGNVQLTATITRQTGFTGSVTLQVISSLPVGVSASYSHPGTGNSGSVILTATTSCELVSDEEVIVRASATGVQSRDDDFLLTTAYPQRITSFSITPTSVRLTPGGQVILSASITRAAGFTAAVSLQIVTTLPTGVSASVANPGTGNSGTIALTATSGVQLVTDRSITVRASATGSASIDDSFLLTTGYPPGIATFVVTPDPVSLVPGGSVQLTATITRDAGFTGSVSLLITSTLPAGVSASYVHPGTGNTGTITLNASTSCALVDDYPVTARASATGVSSVDDTFLLSTGYPPGIATFSVTPDPVSLVPGGSVQVTATITRDAGFTGSVSLLITSTLPAGVSASYGHPGTGNVGTITLSASTSCALVDDYPVTARASATGVSSVDDTFLLSTGYPPGISNLVVIPDTAGLCPGGSVQLTATITRESGFTGSVSLLITTTLPAGISASFSHPGTGNMGTITLNASTSCALVNNSPVTVRASAAGISPVDDTVLLTIGPPLLNLFEEPDHVILVPGENAHLAVTITRAAWFTGSVTLQISDLPPCITASYNHPGTGNTGSITLAASCSSGDYILNLRAITGVCGFLVDTIPLSVVPCSYDVEPRTVNAIAIGQTANIVVTTESICQWSAEEASDWISITSGSTGNGNGTVVLEISPNSTGSPRNAIVTVAGTPVAVSQSSCPVSFDPVSVLLPVAGGSGAIAVTAFGNCSWAVTSSASWLVITSGHNGSGSGTINYTVAANGTGATRIATISGSGATFTLTQSGPAVTVAIKAPVSGAVLSGTVPILIDAYDQVGIAKVEIYIDGDLAKTDSTYPYRYDWDTTGQVGGHTIGAKAFNLSSQSSETQIAVSISTQNSPKIIRNPTSQTVGSGQHVVLSVEATGTAPLTYQWYQGSSGNTSNPIGGATASSYTTPNLFTTTSYWVRVTNSVAPPASSNTAIITVGLPSKLTGTVYDLSTEEPIIAAALALGSHPVVLTDGNGDFEIPDIGQGDYPITVMRSGYDTYSGIVGIAHSGTIAKNFYLTQTASGDISITSLTSKYGGFVYYLNGSDFIVTYTAQINWGGHAPDKVRFITSNAHYDVPASGSVVSRAFNIGTDFTTCTSLKAVAFSSDGAQSEIAIAEFTVMPLPLADVVFERYDLGDSFNYKLRKHELEFINEALDDAEIPDDIPFFGSKGFNLDTLLAVDITAESSGQIDVELDLTETPLAQGEWTKGEIAGFEFSLTPKLHLTAQYAYPGCVYDWSGSLELLGDVSWEKSWPFVVMAGPIPIPMFAKASFDLSAAASLGIENINPVVMDGQLTLEPYLRGSLGAGVDNLLSVEGWIGGGGAFSLQYPATPHLNEAVVYVNAGFSAHALLWHWETEALRWDWSLAGGSAEIPVLGQVSRSPRLISRDYLIAPNAGRFWREGHPRLKSADSTIVSDKTTMYLLQEAVYPYSDASLTASSTQLALTWLQDDPERLAINRTIATFSIYDGNAWGPQLSLGDDGTADFHPKSLLFSDGSAIAVWEDQRVVHSETATFEDMVQNLEISTSVYEPVSGSWLPLMRITDNGYLDGSPMIAGPSNTNVMLTWISNEANDIRGSSTAPSKLWYSLFNGTSWSSPQLVTEIPFGILKQSLIYNGTSGHIVMSLDIDGDPATVADNELFRLAYSGGAWTALARQTEDSLPDVNPKLVFDPAGHVVLAWMRGNDLSCSVDFGPPTVIYADEFSTNLADFKLATSPTGRIAIVWVRPTEYNSDLNVFFYDPAYQTWATAPHQLTFDPEIERNIAAAFYGSNNLVIVYDRTPLETSTLSRTSGDGKAVTLDIPQPGTTDLYLLEYEIGKDLALSPLSLKVSPANPEPGTNVTMTVTAVNAGDEAASSIPVVFYLGDPSLGGTLIGQTVTPALLSPGDAVDISVQWVIPPTNEALRIFAVIDPSSSYDTVIRGNNSINLEIVKPDLSVNGIDWEWLGERLLITARILNSGVVPSLATSVKFRQDSSAGAILSDQVLPAMAMGEFRDVIIEWNTSGLGLPQYSLHVSIDEEGLVNEFDEANNGKLAVVTPVAPIEAILVMSPNGGERWTGGIPHVIQWASSGIIGNVKIEFSADSGTTYSVIDPSTPNSGRYSWVFPNISSSTCLIRVGEIDGFPVDVSDGPFTLVPMAGPKKLDFNRDGQEDILWRYYGSGAYQGLNVAWLMDNSIAQSFGSSDTTSMPEQPALRRRTGRDLLNPRSDLALGMGASTKKNDFLTIMDGGREVTLKPERISRDPVKVSSSMTSLRSRSSSNDEALGSRIRKDAVLYADRETANITAIRMNTEVILDSVPDSAWEIAGTGDFDGDEDVDILWRYYGSGPIQGLNDIWFMDGTTFAGESVFSQVEDTNWQIAGTGDFDTDGDPDILWRYQGPGPYQGLNVIWYMNGPQFASEVVFGAVTDIDWQIAGTGDFDGDGNTDIIWRNYGAGIYQGLNVIWLMDGIDKAGEIIFSGVTDTNWRIAGTGDFNGDGGPDILWRYHGTGPYQGLNVIWYMQGTSFSGEEVFSVIPDTNWRIVNR